MRDEGKTLQAEEAFLYPFYCYLLFFRALLPSVLLS